MAVYQVQAPDGKILQIEGPEGASRDEILEYAAQTYKPSTDGNFVRGVKSYLPGAQETFGGLQVALGAGAKKVLGEGDVSNYLLSHGVENMQQGQHRQDVYAMPTDSLSEAYNKGLKSVVTEWLPFVMGQGVGNVGESLVAAGAGALLGGAVGGPVAPETAAAGFLTGLIDRQLVKSGVKEAAEQILKTEGKDAAEAYLKKEAGKVVGTNLGIATHALVHGFGETTSRAAEKNLQEGKAADDLEWSRLGPAALLHAAADTIATKIGLGALDGLAKPTQSFLLNIVKGAGVTGLKEIPPEVVQSALERYGAGLPLADKEAIKEYIDTAGAAFGMGIVPGGFGGAMTRTGHVNEQGINPLTGQPNTLTDQVNPLTGQPIPSGGTNAETFKQSTADQAITEGQNLYKQEGQIGGSIDTSTPMGRELSSTQAETEALGKQHAALLAPEAATVQPAVAPHESAALALKLSEGLKQNPALRAQFEAAKQDYEAQGRTDLAGVFQTVLDTVPAAKTAPVIAPEVQQKVQQVRKTLIPALKKYGLEGTGLQILDSIGNGKADGYHAQNLVTVALDSPDHLGTVRHETIHALKYLNAFTPQEWQVLTNKAKTEWVPQFISPEKQELYKQQYAKDNNGDMAGFNEYLHEEAIAEAFKHFNNKMPPGMVGNIMYRLKQFFQSVKNVFSGQGFTTADQIFHGIENTKYKPQYATESQGKFDLNGYQPMAYRGEVESNGKRYSLLQHASQNSFDKLNEAKLNAFGFGYGAYASVNKNLNAKTIGKKDITPTSKTYAKNYVTGKPGYVYLADFPLHKENSIFPNESPDSQPAILKKFIEAGIIQPEKKNDSYRTTPEYGNKVVYQMGDALNAMREAYAQDMLISGYPMTGLMGERKPSGHEWGDNLGIQKRIADELDSMGIEATLHPYVNDTHAIIHNPQKFNASLVGKYELAKNGDIKKISGRDLNQLGLFDKIKGVFRKNENGQVGIKPEDLPAPNERRYSLVRPAKEGEKEISTQNATGPKAKFNPLTEMHSIDEKSVLEAMEKNPEIKTRTIAAIKEYGFIPKDTPDDQVISLFKKNIVNNLLYLYNSVPAEIRNRSKLWYDGANKIANQMAKEYGLTDMQVSGILAAMSPQKDWFQNVSMAERAIDILSKRGDMAWDANMLKYAQSYVNETKDRKEREKREIGYKNIEKVAKAGTKLKDMDVESAAGFIRAYDEAYQSRTYRIVTPEGGFSGLVMNNPDKKTGEVKPSTMMWSTYDPIEKSVSIFRDGSRDNISHQLGFEHKIRSFYNNIVAPNSNISHVTIDTHAVAAALFEALAGTDTEVLHNFGGTGKAKNLGVGGTYGLIADAYRDAASQVGLQAREMQSITWEAVRGLFNDDIKATIKAPIRGEWTKYKEGKQTFDQARDRVIKIAGGMNAPQWVNSDAGKTIKEGASSYDKSYQPEGGVRLRQENAIREKITVNLSNVTSSIPGLNELYQRSLNGDEKAYAVLQDTAKAHLEYLLSGTSAKVKIEPVMGAYGSEREPAINASLAFPEADRKEVMAALARFATNFNQQQVHVRQATAYPFGHDFGDKSYATNVWRMNINRQLTNDELADIIKETEIPAITVSSKEKDGKTQWTATTYFVDPFEKTEEKYDKYIKQVQSLDKALARVVGRSDKTVKPSVERLYVYGTGDGARLGYESIAGDVRPKEAHDTRSSNLIANYFKGEPVTGFKQKGLNKEEIAAQKSLVKVSEALPNSDLKRPIVRRAYTALGNELKEQYKILPIKVEVVTDVMIDGESYDYFSERTKKEVDQGRNGIKELKKRLTQGMTEAEADSVIKYLQDNYGEPDSAWKTKSGLLARIEADNKDIYPKKLGSQAMRDDVNLNNRLKVYKTAPATFGPKGTSFKSHPLLKDSGLKDINGYPMLYNDLLRAVHDYYAHNLTPAEFGPRGELAAARNHLAVTKDPMAKWALIAETRLQNAWQNFREGVESIPLIDRPYALQKAALPPIEYVLSGDPLTDVPIRKMMEGMTPEEKLGSLPPSAPIAKNYKYSLREPASRIKAPDTPAFKQWFGDSKIVDYKGRPLVMFHGTARDITEFKPKQANAIFLTSDPTFAEDFGDASEAYMIKELFNGATPQERNKYIMDGAAVARKNGDISPKEFAEIKSDFSQMDVTFGLIPSSIEQEVAYILKNQLPTRQNIIPMFVSSENPFDFGNKQQVDALTKELNKPEYNRFLNEEDKRYGDKNRGFIERGHWSTIESEKVQKALKKLGHDGFFVLEGGRKNLAVYDPAQVKSATGNIGTYSINNPDIRYSLRDKNLQEFIKPSKEKGIWYHGTARDISEFKPKQAGAIFLTKEPEFADSFTSKSKDYMILEAAAKLDKQNIKKMELITRLVEEAIADKRLATAENSGGRYNNTREDYVNKFMDMPMSQVINTAGIGSQLSDYLASSLPTGPNIMPVYVRVQNPFDYQNWRHIKKILNEAYFNESEIDAIKEGDWGTIESDAAQEAIQLAGFDGFYVKEHGYKNLAVYNSNQIKSATGNIGTYDVTNPDIRYSLREPAKIGINVNQDGENKYADKIVDGEKTYETRESDSLKRFWVSGDRVAIVRTGEGTAKAIGEVTIGKPIIVRTQKEFDKYRNQTLIPKGSKFDIKEGGVKYLYPIINPERYSSEFDVGFGHVARKVMAPDIRYALNAPPKRLTTATAVQTAGQQVQQVATNTYQVFTGNPNEFWTKARIDWVDPNGGLTKRLQNLPIFDTKGQLRADMLNRARAQSINLIKNGLTGGMPVINSDGSIIIKSDPVNNIANSQILADRLNNNQFVKDSGLDGRGFVAEVARALRGEEIMQEDAAHNAVNPPAQHLNRELQVDAAQIAWAHQQMRDVPELKQIFSIWKNVNTSLIDLWENVGLLDAKTANEYRAKKSYVSLAASIADLEDRMGQGFGHSYSGTKGVKKIHALEGADLFRNIWENVGKQYASMVSGAYQNQVRKIAVEQLMSVGAAQITNPTDPAINLRYKDQNHPSANKEGIVSVAVVNPNDVAAFESMHYELTPLMKIMSFGTKALRAGALLNPMFWARQMIKDPIHAALTNSPIVTPLHSSKEFINILRNQSPEGRLLAERGVVGQVDSTTDIHEFLNSVGKDYSTKGKTMSAMLHKLMEIHEASDTATRIAIFKKAKAEALARGLSDADATNEAVFKSRESINFSVRGNSATLNTLRHMIPFLSASISSLDTLYKAATGYGLPPAQRKQAQAMFKQRMAMAMVMCIAYSMLMQDDDKYKEVPDYVRDSNFLFPNPFGKGFIRIPAPFEVGFIVKTVPEVAIRYIYGNSTGKQAVQSYLNGVRAILPGDAIPIPQVTKPALETIMNHDLFRGAPIESVGDSHLSVKMRGRNASETAKMLSEAGLYKIGLSPAKIDHLLHGYLAEIGGFTTFLADKAIYALEGKTPMDKNLAQEPFFKSFLTDPTRDKAVGDFYEVYKTANQVASDLHDYKKTGSIEGVKEIIGDEENVKLLKVAPVLRRIANNMTKINNAIRVIQNNQNLPPDDRLQRVNALEGQLARVARQHYQVVKAAGID